MIAWGSTIFYAAYQLQPMYIYIYIYILTYIYIYVNIYIHINTDSRESSRKIVVTDTLS
jgi:hypothetical protein